MFPPGSSRHSGCSLLLRHPFSSLSVLTSFPFQIKWPPPFLLFLPHPSCLPVIFMFIAQITWISSLFHWNLFPPRTYSHQSSDKGGTNNYLWSHAHGKYPHASHAGTCVLYLTSLIPFFHLFKLWHRELHCNFPTRIFSASSYCFITLSVFENADVILFLDLFYMTCLLHSSFWKHWNTVISEEEPMQLLFYCDASKFVLLRISWLFLR